MRELFFMITYINPEADIVLGDSTKLMELFDHLLDNANKFSDIDSKITVSLLSKKDNPCCPYKK